MDNNSNLSPVTESEVMNFASRICTTIVAHSQQQGRIESLERSLSETTSERDHLRSENSRLNQDIGETTTLADGYSRERDDAMRRLQEAEAKLRYQEEMAIQRDAKVAELQTEKNKLGTELDHVHTELANANKTISELRGDLEAALQSRNQYLERANKAESAIHENQYRLDKIPLPIRAHFTGESVEKPKPEPMPPEHAPEMKPVIAEDKPEEQHPSRAWTNF